MSFSIGSKRIRILLLSANPIDTEGLRLDTEQKEIKKSLNYSVNLEKFEILQEKAVTIDDLEKSIRDFKPNIIHFGGHGKEGGIFLLDKSNKSSFVDGKALGRLFRFYKKNISCVILNSCYSQDQAYYISQSVPHVIGTNSTIKDNNAIEFSRGFYSGLLSGYSYERCFELGLIKTDLSESSDNDIPVFYRNGEKIKLVDLSKNISQQNKFFRRKIISRGSILAIVILIMVAVIFMINKNHQNENIPILCNEDKQATVTVQYLSNKNQSIASQLLIKLKKGGFNTLSEKPYHPCTNKSPETCSKIEINYPKHSEIRYFHEEDYKVAKCLKKYISREKLFVNSQLVPTYRYKHDYDIGHIEIWYPKVGE